MNHFGEHLTLDCYGGSEYKLDDKELIVDFLNRLVSELGMNKLSPIEIYKAEDNQVKDPGGWSAFVVIQESHISIHTFPKRKFISADVYTCKNGLNIEFIKERFESTFDIKEIESNFIIRGMKYPLSNQV